MMKTETIDLSKFPLEAEAPAIVCPNGCGSDPFGHCRACGGVPPVAESAKTYSCARCGVPRALQAQDVCADCALLLGWEAPVAESVKAYSCARCGVPRSMPCGLCADCELLEQVTATKVTKADPYELSRYHLKVALDSATPELDVGYETQCLPGQRAARERMVKALRLELDKPLSARRLALAKKYGAREGIDTVGGFSSATWEDD